MFSGGYQKISMVEKLFSEMFANIVTEDAKTLTIDDPEIVNIVISELESSKFPKYFDFNVTQNIGDLTLKVNGICPVTSRCQLDSGDVVYSGVMSALIGNFFLTLMFSIGYNAKVGERTVILTYNIGG